MMIVRLATLYDTETTPLTKRNEEELKEGKFRMILFSLGVTKMNSIRYHFTAEKA